MARLHIRQEVIRRLFALSGNQCAEPSCTHELITTKGKYVAEVCHIEAANPGGARYNELQNDEERRGFQNLILLCHKHHVESDDYDLDALRQMKIDHEKIHDGEYTLPSEMEIKITEQINAKLDLILERVEASITQNNEILDVLQQLSKKVTTPTGPADHSIYAQQLEFIKDLKKKGSYKTALEQLLKYKEQNWDRLSPELQFKTNANIAVLYLNLHDKSEAIKWILTLEDISHEHPDRYAYLALGYGLAGINDQFDRVFDRAVGLGCENSNLWLGYIYRYEDEMDTLDLVASLPVEQVQKSEISFTIADIFYRKNKPVEAKSFLEKAVELETSSKIFQADIKAFMATKSLPSLLTFFKFVQRQYSDDELAEIGTAHRYFTEAWDIFKDTEMASVRTYCVLNRGVLNNLLRRTDEAIRDFQDAYRLTHDYIAFKNLMMTFLSVKNIGEANKLKNEFLSTEPALTVDQRAEVIHFRARLFFLEDKFEETTKMMEMLFTDAFKDYRQRALNTLFHFCMEKQRNEKAGEYHAMLEKDFPDDIETILAKVQLNVGKQESKDAIQLLDKANSFVTAKTEPAVIFELATAYTELKEYDKAIPLLERIADTKVYNAVTRTIIFCHYYMGNTGAAVELAKPLYEQQPDNVSLAELMMKCYDEVAQFENAIAVCKTYIAQPSSRKKDLFRFNAAVLLARLKKDDEKVLLLNEITSFDSFSQQTRFQCAYWFGTTGEKLKGLELAYITRSKFYDDPKAHAAYTQVLQPIKRKKKDLFPATISAGCGVTLEDEDKQIEHYLITDDEVRGENVIPSNSALAQALIGRQKGEKISFEKGFGLQKKYRIKEILSKYTYAFQETTRLFETRFAGQESITVMKSDPEHPFEELEEMLRLHTAEQALFENAMFPKHLALELPLTTIALKSGNSFVREWGNWRSKPDFFQVAFAASNDSSLLKAILEQKGLVIDNTALLLCGMMIGSYHLLESLKLPLYVAQSTLDEIQRFHEELGQFSDEGRRSFGYQDGTVIGHEINKEQIADYRRKLSGIIKWSRANTTVTAPTKAGSTWKERDTIIGIVGKATYDNLCIAEENGAMICSDDAVVVHKLMPIHKLSGFSTFDIANRLRVTRNIPEKEFDDIYHKMVEASYISLPGNAQQIWREFDNAQFHIRKPFTTAAKSFTILLPAFAAKAAAEFLKRLYVQITVDAIRTQTTLYVFRELAQSRSSPDTFQLLPLFLHNEFKLLNPQLNIVLDLLKEFMASE